MDLILWRHADAEYADGDDLARRLTPKGERQAAQMAAWLRAHLPDARVIASAAVRARQTAAALHPGHEVDARLNPDVDPSNYLLVANWPVSPVPTIVVGHQPTIGAVVARLLRVDSASVSVKKGAIWWLKWRLRDTLPQVVLKASLTPDLLK
jgi:phosphohistidine phosphatase